MNQESNDKCKCPLHRKESVLTFDGGGIRGLASLLILKELLLFIKDEEQHRDELLTNVGGPGRPTGRRKPLACHYFNFMFGASTGGIIAIMLGRLRMDIDTCIDVYGKLGTDLFAKKQPFYFLGQNKYDHVKLEKIIKNEASKHCRDGTQPDLLDPMILNRGARDKADIARNRYVPCRVGVLATRTDVGEGKDHKIHLFRSYENPTPPSGRKKLHLNLEDQFTDKIWRIARATSAAPTYFPPMKIQGVRYIDGGIISNNPSQCAWAEVESMHQLHPAGKCRSKASRGGIRIFVSRGTGKHADEKLRTNASPIPKIRSLLKHAIQKMMDPERDHEWLEANAEDMSNGATAYHRFNVETGPKSMNLDECKMAKGTNLTLKTIRDAVNHYLEERDGTARDQLRQLSKVLVDHRRSKCRDPRFHDLSEPGILRSLFDGRFHDDEVLMTPTGPSVDSMGFRHFASRRATEIPSVQQPQELETRIDSPNPRNSEWSRRNPSITTSLTNGYPR